MFNQSVISTLMILNSLFSLTLRWKKNEKQVNVDMANVNLWRNWSTLAITKNKKNSLDFIESIWIVIIHLNLDCPKKIIGNKKDD